MASILHSKEHTHTFARLPTLCKRIESETEISLQNSALHLHQKSFMHKASRVPASILSVSREKITEHFQGRHCANTASQHL
jgi:hypothetical protein